MSSRPATVLAALSAALAADPGRPLVTFYDGATGERIELSVKTFDNWVSKIANLFNDELMLETGDAIAVDLPTHWQSTVTLTAAWAAGLCLVTPGAPTAAAVTITGPQQQLDPRAVQGQVVACSLRPLGGPFLEPLPHGWLDFAREVPSQPDVLLVPAQVTPGDVALESIAGRITHGELVEQGFATASELHLTAGGRLITDANPAGLDGLAAGLVAPLVTGASVVLVTKMDGPTRASIAEQERATASYWVKG